MLATIVRCFSLLSALTIFAICSVGMSNAASFNTGIELIPDINETVVISKVSVSDSRAVRGFLGTPVDGTIHTLGYRGDIVEYPDTGKEGYDAGAGVDYSYNGNDGLHIKFGDSGGFDAVVIRGAARTEMFDNTGVLLEDEDLASLAGFKGNNTVEAAVFSKRTGKGGVSFFGTDKGALADIGFYRISKSANSTKGRVYSLSTADPGLALPESDFAPESILRALEELYPDDRGRLYSLDDNAHKAPNIITMSASNPVHLMTMPFDEKKGVSAVTLDFSIDSDLKNSRLTLIVQDPLDPRLSLMYLPLTLQGNGSYSIELDFPDQLVFKGRRLWLTLIAENDLKLSGPDGGSPRITVRESSVDAVLNEAFIHRKFLLKSLFIVMSESRPWGRYKKQSRDEFYAIYQHSRRCPELFMTIDICHELAPDDDLIRQYREWVYLRNLDKLSDIDLPASPPLGVPDWAWYPRMAWLESRKIAEWWLENRLVPTGEFGGMVGDDTDLYQQWADLPFYESDGVAAQVKAAAAKLAELAGKKHLKNGINILMTDALHAYEDGINHLALMAQWEYGDPVYFERCMESALYMEKLTEVTSDGRRHFRNSRNIGYDEINNPSNPTVDGGSTALMWHTSLQTADYNRNPRVMKTLDEWAESWLGKSEAGKWPTEIEVLSGKITGTSENRPLSNRAQDLTFTWLAKLTGDARYIEPFLHYYRNSEAPSPSSRFLGDIYNMGFIDDLQTEQLNTLAEENSALSFYLNGDPGRLIAESIGNPDASSSAIRNLSDAIRWPDMYTSVEQYTDRLFPSIINKASICILGAYTARNRYLPTRGVSWEGFGTDYGALVLVNRPDSLKVLIYSYSDSSALGLAKIWSLKHGNYRLRIGTDSNADRMIDHPVQAVVTELQKADSIPLRLAPKTVTVLEIGLAEELDSIYDRADLALSPLDCELNGLKVSGNVHNIGSKNVDNVTIAVVDDNGEIVLKKSIAGLKAPIDLSPRKKSFSVTLPRKAGNNWKLVVDPDDSISEIYEGNNELLLSLIK